MNDDSGINLALLAALPAARNVLELGCATGRLGGRYKHAHPEASWTGVDVNAGALDIAWSHLDRVMKLDLNVDAISRAGGGFDLIVLGDVLEHLKEPERLLAELGSVCAGDAGLVCCIPNMSHISVIERLIRGDIMYDPIGLLDTTHLRFLSPRSAFKMLLDSGWLPDAAGGYQGGHANAHFTQAIVDAAQALGIPRKSAELNVHTYQLIVSCKRRIVAPSSQARSRISVIASGDDPS
jgi:SAM-dependent methyltransferase